MPTHPTLQLHIKAARGAYKRAGYIVSKAPENSFICQALRMRKGEKGGEDMGLGRCAQAHSGEDSLAVSSTVLV